MVQKLLERCFSRVGYEKKINSKTEKCKYLADRINAGLNYNVSYKTLEHLYNGYVLNLEKQPEVKQELLDKLAQFIGFIDYADFIERHPKSSQAQPNSAQSHLNKTAYILIGIIFLALIGYPVYQAVQKPECMIWTGKAFERKECDAKQTEAFQQRRFEEMKKLKVDCKTKFFDGDGKAKVFYDKIDLDNLAFFSTYGPSPETSNKLQPITEEIIKNHLGCH